MIIGEAPGYNEDRRGLPFVGKAGQELFGSLLSRFARIPEERCYATNIVKCRPPNNRDPRADEIGNCLPWLQQEFHFVLQSRKLRIVIVAGSVAAGGIFGDGFHLERSHGFTQPDPKWEEQRGDVKWISTYHPAYGLHDSKVMTMIQNDFINVGRVYRGEEVNPVNQYPNPVYRMLDNGMVTAGRPNI